MSKPVRIHLGSTPYDAKIEIDGVDITKACQAVRVSADASKGALLKVELEVLSVDVLLEADANAEVVAKVVELFEDAA